MRFVVQIFLEKFEDGSEIIRIKKCRHVFHRCCLFLDETVSKLPELSMLPLMQESGRDCVGFRFGHISQVIFIFSILI